MLSHAVVTAEVEASFDHVRYCAVAKITRRAPSMPQPQPRDGPVHGIRPELLRLNVFREGSVGSVKLSRMLCRA